ncbi:MAG: hypothetical protein M0Z95_22075 [Actinomycetota bacterium]|nr:hypothetical protein [Actinomycetota bacterium]
MAKPKGGSQFNEASQGSLRDVFYAAPPDQPGCSCNPGTLAQWWILHDAGVPYMSGRHFRHPQVLDDERGRPGASGEGTIAAFWDTGSHERTFGGGDVTYSRGFTPRILRMCWSRALHRAVP